MEQHIIIGVGVAFSLFTLSTIWGLYQNERTARDRKRILDSVYPEPSGPATPDFWDVHRAYDRVSYDAHCRARELLRDPFELYEPCVRKALERAAA